MKKWVVLLAVAICFSCAGCAGESKGSSINLGGQDGQWEDQETPGLGGIDSVNPGSQDDQWENQGTSGLGGAGMPTRTVDCHLCHGDGVCFHCNGDAFRNGRRCSVCDGTGRCRSCGGAGALEVVVINGQDYTVCTTCSGSGQCSGCDGSGKMGYQSSTLGHVGGNCMLCNGSGNCRACRGTGLRELAGF